MNTNTQEENVVASAVKEARMQNAVKVCPVDPAELELCDACQ